MPMFERGDVHLFYEEHGEGHPVLLFAPGGMRSRIEAWAQAPWNPLEELADSFRVIAMDQRNAGRSRAPVREGDGWATYTADHVALLDHLGVERCHVLGGCIGGSYCLGLMQAAPARVTAAVLQQPIGLGPDNRAAFHAMFDSWADELRAKREDVPDAAWASFRERMYGDDFVFNVSRDFVSKCAIPMLVLMGNDLYHPSETSREIVELAPNAELVEHWKDPETVGPAVARVRDFFQAHTPA
jgi:pimeloyl-ACP methyl ester carboxylesterase